MRVRVTPGGTLRGNVAVPGDKSIAHRWILLAATASGPSRLVGVPGSLDVRSTASAMATLAPSAGRALEAWTAKREPAPEASGSTWNLSSTAAAAAPLELEGEGRVALAAPSSPLDCGNSGTTMRLLSGIVASGRFRTVLTGDRSLSVRPMERIAAPLREMGASVSTVEGHAPVTIDGATLKGIHHVASTPSAQVKSAILLAGLAAEGVTSVTEPVATRDHTERALAALGAPVAIGEGRVEVRRFQHGGFSGSVPGDPSSAAFLVAAAALTGSSISIEDVGLNPSRLRFLDVMDRMGIPAEPEVGGEQVGEPIGRITVGADAALHATRVGADELPLVIDEIPVLALLAANAGSETRFVGAAELRVKESDRLGALVEGIRALGGDAAEDGDDLVVAGGGLAGGVVSSGDDHRIAMAFAVGALGARGPVEIGGMEAADVSFPGFVSMLSTLGVTIEVVG